jgi:predicted amidohydrolase YtcJ
MEKIKKGFLFFAIIIIGFMVPKFAAAQTKDPADLVILHGKVVTVDPFRPHAEAVAISADTIRAVGTDRSISKLAGNKTKVIDAKGLLVIPGFIEGHGHLMQLGETLNELNLANAHNWSDIVQKVKKTANKADSGDWILGYGWHQEKWDHPPEPNVNGWPTNAMLNKVSPDNPVLLTHASGHGIIANKKALELAGVTAKTKSPEGGTIVHGKNGEPIGVLLDDASALVYKAHAQYLGQRSKKQAHQDRIKQLQRAAKDAISKGITTFKAESNSLNMIDFFKKLDAAGKLPLRIYAMIDEPANVLAKALPKYRHVGRGNWFLTVRSIGEKTIDGALGTHTALMLKPYNDLPDSTGLQATSTAEETKTAKLAIKYGYQMDIHAIGDRANREVLDIYQKVFRKHPNKTNLRWEISHAQHLNPKDLPRFAKLGIIANMQGIHACSDGPYVVKRLGEKRAREGAYAWHKLIAHGTVVTNGTDTPVEDENPIPNFKCSVTRQLKSGAFFYPKEDMTRLQALKSYTINNAYSMFQEDHLGSITPGKLADIAILSRNIMSIPYYSIDSTKVVYTIIGGKVKYDHGEFKNM